MWVEGARREARLAAAAAAAGAAAAASRARPSDRDDVVFADGEAYAVAAFPPLSGAGASGAAADGKLTAPMPGRVVALAVVQGQRVAKGAPVVTLEAMKMEHGMTAPFDAVVAEAPVTVGQQVTEGALLVRLVAQAAAGE